jgi:hypothetical protein
MGGGVIAAASTGEAADERGALDRPFGKPGSIDAIGAVD